MKAVFSILMIVLLAFQFMVKTSTIIWFEYNQTQIAETSCENKDRPEINCNGKCVLSKKLAAAEQEEHQAPNPHLIKVKLEPTTFESELKTAFNNSMLIAAIFWPKQAGFKTSTFICSVFHPPQFG